MKLNAKQVYLSIMKQKKPPILKQEYIPKHLKKYPNLKFRRNQIINIEEVVSNSRDVNLQNPIELKFKSKRIPSRIKEVRPPQHDFMNFKLMSGNEILLNMINVKYFRNGELVNAFNEFSKRINLQENKDLQKENWIEHPYFVNVFRRIMIHMNSFNLKNVIVSSIALDRYNFNSQQAIWKVVEKNVDRLMHKLKPSQIILFLDLFNRQPGRANKNFLNKLLTIIPIHVEHLKDEELLKLVKVCLDQDLINERLFSYFIYPRIESRASKFSFKYYLNALELLSELHYQDDQEFWNSGILPCIFNYEYTGKDAQKLFEALLRVKINCPNIDISKHLLLVENILKQFDNLKESGEDISDIVLRLETDYTLMPTKKEALTLKQVKETEKRLKDQAALKSFMERINQQEGTAESKAKEAEININKLLEVKDWKKARYELNLAEMESLRENREKLKEERATKVDKKTIKLNVGETLDEKKEVVIKEEKVVDIEPEK